MGRRKKGEIVNGWVCLDKPFGMGSTEAVSKVRRLFDAQKAGHAGTLDPLASGILPIALGEATKTVPFMMEAQKVYRFTINWGISTDSLDREGEITGRSDVRPDVEAVRAALPAFVGEIDQVPPQFSAIRVNGERAYDLARDGTKFELESRRVFIHEAIFDDVVARLGGRLAALRSGRFDVAGWRSRQLLEGWEVELDLGAEGLLTGRVAGYDGASGALILSVDGTERAIHAGEVTRVVRAVTP